MIYNNKTEKELIDLVMEELNTSKNWEYLKSHFEDSGQLNHAKLVMILEKLKNERFVVFVDDGNLIYDRELKDPWYVRKTIPFYPHAKIQRTIDAENALIKMADRGWFERHPKTSFIIAGLSGAVLGGFAQKYLLPLLGL